MKKEEDSIDGVEAAAFEPSKTGVFKAPPPLDISPRDRALSTLIGF